MEYITYFLVSIIVTTYLVVFFLPTILIVSGKVTLPKYTSVGIAVANVLLFPLPWYFWILLMGWFVLEVKSGAPLDKTRGIS